MSVFSYDVIFLDPVSEIVNKFLNWPDARVIFSAEAECWPHKSLASRYPEVSRGKRYLNSGGFIGYATDLYAIVNSKEIKDADDDQLFYTMVYLDPEMREKHKIKLDHKSEIFQNLYSAICESWSSFAPLSASLHAYFLYIIVLLSSR